MVTFTILLNGDICITDRLRRQICGSRVIAADGGMRHAEMLDVIPELWLGDFDSSDRDLLLKYRDIPCEFFPVDKDRTDCALACEKALQQGAKRIILCGAFGGERTDHSLSHMMQAMAMSEKGISVLLTSGSEEGWPVLSKPFLCDLPEGCLFSLIGFSDLKGLTMSGAQWSLSNEDIPFGSSLTLSNKICQNFYCSLYSGRAMLLASLPIV